MFTNRIITALREGIESAVTERSGRTRSKYEHTDSRLRDEDSRIAGTFPPIQFGDFL